MAGKMTVHVEPLLIIPECIQAIVRSNPDCTASIRNDSVDGVVTQARGISRVMTEPGESMTQWIKSGDPVAFSTNPEGACAILGERGDRPQLIDELSDGSCR